MSNHTKAPWAVVTELRPEDEIVADMVNKMWVIPAEHQRLGDNYADARLIAAAPDLLEVLQKYDKLTAHDGWYADLVKSVIVKATGDSDD